MSSASTTLQQLLKAAYAQTVAVTAHSAGYLTLQVLRALSEPQRLAPLSELHVTDEGRVEAGSGRAVATAELDSGLRSLLRALLVLVPTVPPALQAVAQRTGGACLQRLEGELLAALIPLNPAASRRALGRLSREATKMMAETDARVSWERVVALSGLELEPSAAPRSSVVRAGEGAPGSLLPAAGDVLDWQVSQPLSPRHPPAIEAGSYAPPPIDGDLGPTSQVRLGPRSDPAALAAQFLSRRPSDVSISQGLLDMLGLRVRRISRQA